MKGARLQIRAEMPLWLQLGKVVRTYQDRMADRLRHLGVERHFFLLLAINEGRGSFTQQDLADLVETDKVTMVGILNYLSKRGFINRKADKADGRKNRIELTARAVAALPEIRKAIAELNRKALSALPASMSGKFPDALKAIRTELEKSPPAASRPRRGPRD